MSSSACRTSLPVPWQKAGRLLEKIHLWRRSPCHEWTRGAAEGLDSLDLTGHPRLRFASSAAREQGMLVIRARPLPAKKEHQHGRLDGPTTLFSSLSLGNEARTTVIECCQRRDIGARAFIANWKIQCQVGGGCMCGRGRAIAPRR